MCSGAPRSFEAILRACSAALGSPTAGSRTVGLSQAVPGAGSRTLGFPQAGCGAVVLFPVVRRAGFGTVVVIVRAPSAGRAGVRYVQWFGTPSPYGWIGTGGQVCGAERAGERRDLWVPPLPGGGQPASCLRSGVPPLIWMRRGFARSAIGMRRVRTPDS